MENTQNVQNQSSQVQTPKPELRNLKPKATSSWDILIHTFIKYHWLFLIGFLGVSLGGATISLHSLTHVEQLNKEQPEQVTVEVPPTITVSSPKTSPIPLWTVVAITLSCASGCLILCRWINRPLKPKKYRRWEARNQQQPVPKPQEQLGKTYSSTKKSQKTFERKFVRGPQTHVPQKNGYRNRTTQIPPMKRVPIPKKSVTSILPPPSQSFSPMNQKLKTKESLVDTMDLRKQNSLSALFEKSNLSAK